MMIQPAVLALLLHCGSCFSLCAQSYFTTGGIRLGSDYGISLKQLILKRTTLEMIVSTDDQAKTNLGLCLLAAQHKPILTRNLNIFYGAGLAWNWQVEDLPEGMVKRTLFGFPVQAGLEFKVGRINFSWDYTPVLYISTKSNAFDSLKGLTVRYVFLNRKEGKRLVKQLKSIITTRKGK